MFSSKWFSFLMNSSIRFSQIWICDLVASVGGSVGSVNVGTARVSIACLHCVLGDVGWTSPISGACLCLMPDMGAPMNVLMYVTIVLCTVS